MSDECVHFKTDCLHGDEFGREEPNVTHDPCVRYKWLTTLPNAYSAAAAAISSRLPQK